MNTALLLVDPYNDFLSDLRAVLQRCRPDWDISSADQRAAWAKGDKARFHPYGRTQAQVLAEQEE